jgi:hypothetical protein
MSRAVFCYGLPLPSLRRVLVAHLVVIAVVGLVVALVTFSGCATPPPPPDGLEAELELPDAGAVDPCHYSRDWVPGIFGRSDRALFCLHPAIDAGPSVAP